MSDLTPAQVERIKTVIREWLAVWDYLEVDGNVDEWFCAFCDGRAEPRAAYWTIAHKSNCPGALVNAIWDVLAESR